MNSTVLIIVPAEISILTKEHFNRWYSLKTYYIATNILDIPITVRNEYLINFIDIKLFNYYCVLDTRLFDIFRDNLPDDGTANGMD